MRLSPALVFVCVAIPSAAFSTAFLLPCPGTIFSTSTSHVSRGHYNIGLGEGISKRTTKSITSRVLRGSSLLVSSKMSISSSVATPDDSRQPPRVESRCAAIFRAAGNTMFKRRLSEQKDLGAAAPSSGVRVIDDVRSKMERKSRWSRQAAVERIGLGERGWVRKTIAGCAAAVVIGALFFSSSVSAAPMGQVLDMHGKREQMTIERGAAMEQETLQAQVGEDAKVGRGNRNTATNNGVAVERVGGEEQLVDDEASEDKRLTFRRRFALADGSPRCDVPLTLAKKFMKYWNVDETRARTWATTMVLVWLSVFGVQHRREQVRVEISKYEQERDEWFANEDNTDPEADIEKQSKGNSTGPSDPSSNGGVPSNPEVPLKNPTDDAEKEIQDVVAKRKILRRKRDEARRKRDRLKAEASANDLDDLLDDDANSQEGNTGNENQ